MPRYAIHVAEAALKELRKLGHASAREILAHVSKKLGDDPHAFGRPLGGDLAGYYRLRVAGYRVVFRIVEDKVWVVVLAAGKREAGNVDNIYDWLSSDVLARRLEHLLQQIENADDPAES